MKIKQIFVWIIIILVITAVLLIALFLASKYYSNVYPLILVSNKSGDWGAFGDYLGGVLNPIIALVGTLLLAFISMKLSKDDSEEKLNYFKKEQIERYSYFKKEEAQRHEYFLSEHKIKAYDMLTRKIKEYVDIEVKCQTINILTNGNGNIERAKDELGNKAFEMILLLKELYNEILFFPLKYDHLFKYNCQSDKFKTFEKVINDSKKNIDEILLLKEKIKEDSYKKTNDQIIVEIYEFISDLQEELIVENVN